MPHGYWGKVLRVDLSSGKIGVQEHDWKFYRRYLGGWNMVADTLLREVPGDADPLGPANVFVFAAGVCTGVTMSTSGRSAVGAKSPLTEGFGEADVGGFWGAELKHAGWDGIIITGASPVPVYLWIKDDQVEIREARHLWGRQTLEVQEAIKQELGDPRLRVAQIGPAGEKLSRHAVLLNDINHVAGRGGLGAVLGSKKLRAVAVRGTQSVAVADPEYIRSLVAFVREKVESDAATNRRHTWGTSGLVVGLSEAGGLPTRNFRDGAFEGAAHIDGHRMAETIRVKMDTCYACGIRCKPVVRVAGRYNVEPAYGGPEYETMAAFGSNCGVDDLEAIAKANELCARYGIDTISTGVTVAWAMEAYEKGLLTSKDTGGIDLRFGNAPAMVQAVELICKREGIGEFLSEGRLPLRSEAGPGQHGLRCARAQARSAAARPAHQVRAEYRLYRLADRRRPHAQYS
jgi:aldehyde:ferredoxin oxidoreductase